MKKFLLSLIFLFIALPASAQDGLIVAGHTPPVNFYYKAEVTAIINEGSDIDPFVPALERYYQEVRIKFLEGPYLDQEEIVRNIPGSLGEAEQNLKIGEKVVIIESEFDGQSTFAVADRYRIDSLIWLALIFIVLVVIFAGWKGARSILGLAFSILVIVYYILPRILEGQDSFSIFLIGGLAIAVVSVYLGHGFNRRTSIAVVSTVLTLLISLGLATLAIEFASLFGLGSHEAFYVQVGDYGEINLRGLLLGGMLIGVLGVLDDITTAQSAVVQEIYRANTKLKLLDLAKRGLSVGHEHIVSLVNTLALAYVGASLPLLILFTETTYVPLWITLNSERIVEEVVRTLVGSSALIVAVPITTYLAAYFFTKYGLGKSKKVDVHKH